jgi:hypothetical protein
MKAKPIAGQVNEELSVLRRDFKNLSVEGKRGILKTAKGLLKIQRERIAGTARCGGK